MTARRTSYLVKRVQLVVGALLSDAVRPYDLTAGEYTILSLLSREGGLSSAQLARRLYVKPQAMTDLILALEERGLIIRAPLPENRRVLRATLTPRGRRLLARCDRAVDGAEKAFLVILTAREVATLRSLLERLLSAADRQNSTGSSAALI